MRPFTSAASARQPAQEGVRGERGGPTIARTLSVQAKISNLLAMGLMLAIGAGLLLWYYSHQLTRQTRARQTAQSNAARHAAAEMALPPLGPIVEPIPQRNSEPKLTPSAQSGPLAAPLALSSTLPPVALMPAPAAGRDMPADERTPIPARQAGSTPRTALDRRLSGGTFATASAPTGISAARDTPAVAASVSLMEPANAQAAPAGPIPAGTIAGAPPDGLSALLKPPLAPAVSARLLPSRSLLLPKGAFIDCTLETAIDSILPGITTCVTATDTFGADGRVVLLERGTKLVGETQGQVQQGSARVFVLWSEARTPTGVMVPLDSPGADELGRSGLSGTVQRHFWQRFGAAIMISTLDGAVQAAVQSSNRGSGTVIYDPAASQQVMTEALKSTVAIAPTVIKHNGDRIQVLVARDVDFSSVYELRRVDGE